jgi:hypothetical protein
MRSAAIQRREQDTLQRSLEDGEGLRNRAKTSSSKTGDSQADNPQDSQNDEVVKRDRDALVIDVPPLPPPKEELVLFVLPPNKPPPVFAFCWPKELLVFAFEPKPETRELS